MRDYIIGENTLADNEWLLKTTSSLPGAYPALHVTKGFMTKFTQKGVLPKAFIEWGSKFDYSNGPNYNSRCTYPIISTLPISIMEEVPREGWSIHDCRIGKSQEWATMLHPLGFTVEIYLSNLLDLIPDITIIKGVLQGQFYWNAKKLYKAL